MMNLTEKQPIQQLNSITVIKGCTKNLRYTELQQMLRIWTEVTHKPDEPTGQTNTIPTLKEMDQLASNLDDIQFYNRHKLCKNPKSFTNTTGYRYNFLSNMFTDSNSEIRSITFTIEELYHDIATSGGATFHIIVSGATTRSMCNYQDQFNGNYTVCCPVIDTQNNSIQIQLMNVQFHSYKLHRSHFKIIGILNYYILSNAFPRSTYATSISEAVFVKHVTLSGTFVRDTSFWQRAPNLKKDDNWVRQLNTSKKTKSVTKEKLSKCMLEKYNKVFFVGDSHIRYVYIYTKALLRYMKKGETGKAMMKKDSYKSVNFGFVTYAKNFVKGLNNIKKKIKLGDKILLLASVGAWDTHYDIPTSFVKGIQSGLKKLKFLKEKYDIKVIWQTIPPVPQAIEYSLGGNHKVKVSNTFVNSALNVWLSTWLESIGVNVIDLLEIARAIKDTNVCGGHYLCITPQKTMFGVVGLEAIGQILEEVC